MPGTFVVQVRGTENRLVLAGLVETTRHAQCR
jgi:hypothetical protein